MPSKMTAQTPNGHELDIHWHTCAFSLVFLYKKLLEIGIMLSAGRDLNRLLELPPVPLSRESVCALAVLA